jgi:phenylalanyl-tRNA synthetase beta chain
MEVEELRPVAPPFSGVVVAEILSAEQHPQADRLRVCRSMPGRTRPTARCRSSAARPTRARHPRAAGHRGAELPPGDDGKPFKIGVGKLRGVESRGMLCSARELKIADDHAACWNWQPTRRWVPTCATG